jgi:hypothetical protein
MRTDFLGRVLLLNAAYTAVCGLVLLLLATVLALPFGLAQPLPLQVVGGFLLLVAGGMAFAAKMVRRTLAPALLLTVGDAGYVGASLGLALLFPGTLSALGRLSTIGVAASVAMFVVAQAVGLVRARN